MDIVTFSEARANLKAVMDRACADRAPVVVKRARGQENVVLVAESEWEGLQETLHLLASPANAKHLLEGIARLEAGEGEEHELIQPVKVVFDREAWAEYVAWQAEDAKIVGRINLLIGECLRDPFRGTGKPEPLRQQLSGWWSRRITGEHRLVYRVTGREEAQALEVLSVPVSLLRGNVAQFRALRQDMSPD